MASGPQLLTTEIAVGPLGAGVSVTVNHGIFLASGSIAPNIVMPDRNTNIGVASVTSTQITFTNFGQTSDTANFLVELENTYQRDLQSTAVQYWKGGSSSDTPTNVLPPGPLSPAVRTVIYVRTAGSDTTGDGSLAKPYATVQHALGTIPIFIPFGQTFVVDCTGINQNTGATGLQIPMFLAPAQFTINASPDFSDFTFEAPITIQAIPNPASGVPVADTHIAAGEITLQTLDANTGLLTIQTTKTWPLNAFKGKKLVSSSGATFTIQSNTAGAGTGTLSTAGFFTVTAPLSIVEESATLTSTSTANPTVTYSCQANLSLNGIKIVPSAAGVDLQTNPDCGSLFGIIGALNAPLFQGMATGGFVEAFSFGIESAGHDIVYSGTPPALFYCSAFAIGKFQGDDNAENEWTVQGFTGDGCGIMGVGAGGNRSLAQAIFQNMHIVASVGFYGIEIGGASSGPSILNQVRIDNGTTNAAFIGGGTSCTQVTGTGSAGKGFSFAGFPITVDSTTSLVGNTGEITCVGSTLPDRTWTDFRTNFPQLIQMDNAAWRRFMQSGTNTLTNGVSPAIAAKIAAGSRILAMRKDASGATVGVLEAKSADRSVGNPGSFKVTATTLAGATDTNDQSTFDWWIVEDGPANQYGTQSLLRGV